MMLCAIDDAQCIQVGEDYYHASWMVPVSDGCNVAVNEAEVIAIDETEYDSLASVIEANKQILLDTNDDENIEDESVGDEIEDVTIDYLISSKVAEMSAICNKVIVNGFDVVLSDKIAHHFSLSTQDQLNLITLSTLIASGETYIPYHADDELCKYYSVEDVTAIITAATAHKTYHVSYYNSLKAYVESLSEAGEISAVTYGMRIPVEHQSEVLQQLIAAMSAGDEE